ncbi:hypothetical protein GKZ90_0021130 [Flavobacterium sp. MC2016-06]|uniref:hypothetical protein n=1 Tax=Flavobacterium sp. MC2016-06 TaxID=2676308 RepID=UPI0012BA7C6B|nr:hypothetical protein [Flavobacterium sp. MC2016-06]MBU3861005.1 hypothetical protein [Flavobacterium sp. MC2016-06]
MIEIGGTAKKVGDFLKDYLSVIIVIPAAIGGAWQAVELMNISIPFIRFFSISQVVPDGLVVLLAMIGGIIPMSIGAIFGYVFGEVNPVIIKKEEMTDEEKIVRNGVYLKTNQTIFLITTLFCLVWYFCIIFFDNNDKSFYWFALYLCTAIGILALQYFSMHNLLVSHKIKAFKLFSTIKVTFLGVFLIIIVTLSKQVHQKFLITNNFINLERVNAIISKKFPTSKNEILYFNDKYLFYKITFTKAKSKDSKEFGDKIYILELNQLFDKNEN